MEREAIYIQPMGDSVLEDDVQVSCGAVEAYFGRQCKVLPVQPLPEKAYNTRREQHDAETILGRLLLLLPEDAASLIGIVDVDLYAKLSNFVFGFASLTNRVAVHSLARYRNEFYGLESDTEAFHRRMIKVMVHELGHTFGLRHCRNNECVMVYSSTLPELDLGGQFFCPKCGSGLERRLDFDFELQNVQVARFVGLIAGKKAAAAAGVR